MAGDVRKTLMLILGAEDNPTPEGKASEILAWFDVEFKPAIADAELGQAAYWAMGSDSFTQEHRGERLRLRLAEKGLRIVREDR